MTARKSSRVNQKYKTKYRIRNWRKYDRGLKNRGDVTIWLSEEVTAAWTPPKTDTWRRRAPLPTTRSGIAAAVVGGLIFVFGGESRSGTFRENEAYDPVKNAWAPYAPMPTARHGLAAVAAGDRIFVIAGGPVPGGSESDKNEMFLP